MKCMECSYQTENKDQKYCPYDGSELVESNKISEGTESIDIDEESDE